MKTGHDYVEDGADFYERRIDPARRLTRLTTALHRLGYDVTLTPTRTTSQAEPAT